MFGILNAVVAVSMMVGSGTGVKSESDAAVRPGPAYTVHFATPVGGYPVSASLSFATWGEADRFAAIKRSQGYSARIASPLK